MRFPIALSKRWAILLTEIEGGPPDQNPPMRVDVVLNDKRQGMAICQFSGHDNEQRAHAWADAIGLDITTKHTTGGYRSDWQLGEVPETLAGLYMLCLDLTSGEAEEMADLGGFMLPDPAVPTLGNESWEDAAAPPLGLLDDEIRPIYSDGKLSPPPAPQQPADSKISGDDMTHHTGVRS